MALSIDAIFQPLNDFFVNTFGAPAGSQVRFRFDKLGSVIAEADFIDPSHPELGYLPALAVERFSDLVNRVPVECGDDRYVILTQNSIDDTYFYRLLSPAVGYVPPGTDPDTGQQVQNAFAEAKSAALTLWNNAKLESLSGLMLEYKPSQATPQNWYDDKANAIWTTERFEISQPGQSSSGGETSAGADLWTLTPPPDQVVQIINTLPPRPMPQPGPIPPNDRLEASPIHAVPGGGDDRAVLMTGAPATRAARPIDLDRLVAADTVSAAMEGADSAGALPLRLRRTDLLGQVREFDIRDRLQVVNALNQQAQTAPAHADKVAVNFDYCLVQIHRPWLFDVFLNGTNWAVPGTVAGALSTPDTPGSITELPIGMVVIRNLSITADWDAADVAASEGASSFGPFHVDGGIVNGAISHPSIQTIGWMLQQLPSLPPNAIA